jgi:hypothetical protein
MDIIQTFITGGAQLAMLVGTFGLVVLWAFFSCQFSNKDMWNASLNELFGRSNKLQLLYHISSQ